jgi:serine transporter
MSTISPDSGTLATAQAAKWNKTDTVWMFGLYATAVGAGTLFLPINAGLNGPLVLLLMALFAFPADLFTAPRIEPLCAVRFQP